MHPKKLEVLLVEDNPGDALLIEDEMRDFPGRVSIAHAETLSAGRELLSEHAYDVVLLDLSLPDSHGLDTVRALREDHPETPIVVLTGLEDEKVAMEAMRAGAQDYLVKGTVDGDRLYRVLRYAIERRRAAAELRELREQLALSEKLSTLGALVSGLAQELRGSTTSITNTLFEVRSAAEAAAQENPDNQALAGEINDHCAAAMDGVDRIDRLVRDLRSFTRGAWAEDEAVSLSGPVRAAVDIFRTTFRSHIHVDASLEATPALRLRPTQVQQVVLNLLANAAEAMPDGGTVEVRTRPVEGGGELVVRDEGPGLSPDAQQRLFEPFFSTKPDSAGLGLSIAQRIVDAHGGSITVDSLPGRGTTFTVRFPSHAASGPGAESRASA